MAPNDSEHAPVELTATGRVILGMIASGRRTGYDIKAFVDKTTRYFWAASYGQIYPELKRLEDQGLVRGRSEPSGGRARTVYELTEAGAVALRHWLESDEETLYELRDEGMLKLFFSDSAARGTDRDRSGDAHAAGARARAPALDRAPRKQGTTGFLPDPATGDQPHRADHRLVQGDRAPARS